MATELKQKQCHLCEKEVRSASWRSVHSILKAPKGAQWCYRGVCWTIGRHLPKATRGESTPLGPVSSQTRHNRNAPRQIRHLSPNHLNKGVADAQCDPGEFLGFTRWFHSCFLALLCFAVHLLLFVPARGNLKAWGRFHAFRHPQNRGGGGGGHHRTPYTNGASMTSILW